MTWTLVLQIGVPGSLAALLVAAVTESIIEKHHSEKRKGQP